jgi:hypothetical protein
MCRCCSRNDIVVYKRSLDGKEILVALNIIHQLANSNGKVYELYSYPPISMVRARRTMGSSILLRADEAGREDSLTVVSVSPCMPTGHVVMD